MKGAWDLALRTALCVLIGALIFRQDVTPSLVLFYAGISLLWMTAVSVLKGKKAVRR